MPDRHDDPLETTPPNTGHSAGSRRRHGPRWPATALELGAVVALLFEQEAVAEYLRHVAGILRLGALMASVRVVRRRGEPEADRDHE